MALVISPNEKDPQRISAVVHQLVQGRSNAGGVVTLSPGVALTVVTAPNCGAGANIFLFPKTANAAAEIGAGTCYVLAAEVVAGNFTIRHAVNGLTDRTFSWIALG